MYNIPEDILEYGESKGLKPIGTGGHIDYMSADLGDDWTGIIVDAFDAGSPDSLNSPACVSLNKGEYWEQGIVFEGITARTAIDLLALIKKTTLNSFNVKGLED
jgi:hypothetical protein